MDFDAVNRSEISPNDSAQIRLEDNSNLVESKTKDAHSWLMTDLSPYTLYEARVALISPAGLGPFSEPPEVFRSEEEGEFEIFCFFCLSH